MTGQCAETLDRQWAENRPDLRDYRRHTECDSGHILPGSAGKGARQGWLRSVVLELERQGLDRRDDRMSSTVIVNLNAEWQALINTGSFADTFDSWCLAWPELATAQLGHNFQHFDRQHLTRDQVDEILHALLSAHHAGDRYAGRIALQCMLPCVTRIANRSIARHGSIDEAAQVTAAAMWDAIEHYDLERTSGVSTRLWSRTLTKVTKSAPSPDSREIPCDPTTVQHIGINEAQHPEDDILGTSGEVLRLIAWGLDEGIISGDEASLLTKLYGDNAEGRKSHDIAAELGITPAAVRQRTHRAVRRLAQAVQKAL